MTHSTESSPPIEDLGRLALALAVSAFAHVVLASLLPQSVEPYEGAPRASSITLTVSLQPALVESPKVAGPVASTPPPAESNASAASSGPVAPSLAPQEPAPQELVPQDLREMPFDLAPTPDRPALPLLDYFYSSREVDSPAKAVGDALLVYPREALRLRVSGEVKLRLFIDESGALVRSEVVSADPPGIFEEAAAQAVRTMRFEPARKADQPVRSQRTVQISFDPHPEEHPASTSE